MFSYFIDPDTNLIHISVLFLLQWHSAFMAYCHIQQLGFTRTEGSNNIPKGKKANLSPMAVSCSRKISTFLPSFDGNL